MSFYMDMNDRKSFFITTLISFAISITLIVMLAKMNFTQHYPDFIVGSLAWYAGGKLQDLLLAPVFIIAFILSFKFSFPKVEKLIPQSFVLQKNIIMESLLWWIIPVLATGFGVVMGYFLKQPVDFYLFYMLMIGMLTVIVLSIYVQYKNIDIYPKEIGLAVFTILLISCLPLEYDLLLGRFFGISGQHVSMVYSLYGIGLLFVAILTHLRPNLFRFSIAVGLLAGQLGLTSWYFTLYPASFVNASGVTTYQVSNGLHILIFAVVAWAVVDIIHRFIVSQKKDIEENIINLISPIAMFAIVVVFICGQTSLPFISPDDYHFGEQLIGWWMIIHHNVVPYVGYIPPHGLIDEIPGFISYLFYDGTASTISEAGRLGYFIFVFLAYFSLLKNFKSTTLGIYCIFFLLLLVSPYGGQFQWLILIPFLCLWLNENSLSKPSRWLAIWIVSAPLLILIVPPQGLIAVAASFIIVMYILWNIWQMEDKRNLWEVAIGVIAILLSSFLIPLWPMLKGAIGYVIENGMANQVAYGVPWTLSLAHETALYGAVKTLAFEFVRMSWVFCPLLVILVFISNFKKDMKKDVFVPAIVGMGLLFLLIPYSMGRIDPEALSRPGLVAIFAWTVLVPISVWSILSKKQQKQIILLVALFGIMLNYGSLSRLSIPSLVSAANAQLITPPLKNAKKEGLPNIGNAYVQPSHWDRLTRLNTLLNKVLLPGEPYLDLTSRNAQYFYMNRPPVIPVSAPYNMPTVHQQNRAIKILSNKLPKIALFEGDNITHDGGGLALRNHALFLFVLDHYEPKYEHGFVIGYRKDIQVPTALPKTMSDHQISIPVKNITDLNWVLGVNRTEAALVLSGSIKIYDLKVGSEVTLDNGEKRRINRIWNAGNAIWLDGVPLDPSKTGAPHSVKVFSHGVDEKEKRLVLLDRAFAVKDLKKIPVSWGQSAPSLHEKMKLVERLTLTSDVVDLIPVNGSYKVVGNDSQMIFDISGKHLNGRQAGILEFEFSCINKKEDPRIQIFWKGDEQRGFSEDASMFFTASNGSLIIPLDAYPRWLALKNANGIRVDLVNSEACGAIKINNPSLYQRY